MLDLAASVRPKKLDEAMRKLMRRYGGATEDLDFLDFEPGRIPAIQVIPQTLQFLGDVYRHKYHVSVRHDSFKEALEVLAGLGYSIGEHIDAAAFELSEGTIAVDADIILLNASRWYEHRNQKWVLPGEEFLFPEALAIQEYLGLRPASLIELVGLAQCFPGLDLQKGVVAMGSKRIVEKEGVHVAALAYRGEGREKRELDTICSKSVNAGRYERFWNSSTVFACVAEG